MTAAIVSSAIALETRLSSIREIVCGLRSDLRSRYYVTVLKAFIDDSGSGGDSKWYVLAGYVATVEAWDSFDAKWTKVLQKRPRIEYFKASEAEHLGSDGQWAGVTREKRDEKINELIGVIGRTAHRAVCACIRQSDYNEFVKGNIPKAWDSPYYFLMLAIVSGAIKAERDDGNGDSIDFVFDTDEQHEKTLPNLIPSLLSMQCTYESLVNISRRDEKKFLPLQAADLLAWQIRRRFSNPEELERPHFRDAQSCPRAMPFTFIVNRNMVAEMIRNIRESAAALADSMGRSPDVRTWE